MHMSQQVFAQYIDMSPASLSSIFNGRTKPTLNIVEAIKRKCPSINTDWLMFGSGDMYVANGEGKEEAAEDGEKDAGREQSIDFGDEDAPTPQVVAREHNHSSGTRNGHYGVVREEVKYVDKPQRRVMEIRVYYDDLTFESFVPVKK